MGRDCKARWSADGNIARRLGEELSLLQRNLLANVKVIWNSLTGWLSASCAGKHTPLAPKGRGGPRAFPLVGHRLPAKGTFQGIRQEFVREA